MKMKIGKLYKVRDWEPDGTSKGGISLYDPDGKDIGVPRLFVGDTVMYLGEDIYGGNNIQKLGVLCYLLTGDGGVGAYSHDSSVGRRLYDFFEEAKKPE